MSDVNPRHVGLILDGNRRWARAHKLPTLEGHRRGYDNLKTIAQYAFDRGTAYVTAYIFSTENWKRAEEEVNYLMSLAKRMLKRDARELLEKGYRVVMLGARDKLSSELLALIEDVEAKSQQNDGPTLCLCFNYGGHEEIAAAVQRVMMTAKPKSKITTEHIAAALYHPEVPDVDLIIRTSGEQRLSNFMLWRAAYAELYFTDKHWPDFTTEDFDRAIEEFVSRQRRFGS